MAQHVEDQGTTVAGNIGIDKQVMEDARQRIYAETRARREHYQAALAAHGYVLGTSNTKDGLEALVRASHLIAEEERNDGRDRDAAPGTI